MNFIQQIGKIVVKVVKYDKAVCSELSNNLISNSQTSIQK